MTNIREYALANKQWLENKSRENGVIALSQGVLYKVLTIGNNDGVHPSHRSVVTVHYTRRTINGNVFDSSCGETKCR